MKQILIKPVMTEKSLTGKGRYVFLVSRAATKPEIIHAIESMYKVEVAAVRTLVLKGKIKSVGRKRVPTRRPATKKAYITVSKGEIADAQTA